MGSSSADPTKTTAKYIEGYYFVDEILNAISVMGKAKTNKYTGLSIPNFLNNSSQIYTQVKEANSDKAINNSTKGTGPQTTSTGADSNQQISDSEKIQEENTSIVITDIITFPAGSTGYKDSTGLVNHDVSFGDSLVRVYHPDSIGPYYYKK